MNKLGVKAFSLVETLVAAAVIAFAVLSVVAIIRKGQEYTWVNLHRRTARAILDTTLEGKRFYPGNYGAIPASITSDSVALDAATGRPKAERSFSITPGIVDIVAYISVTAKLRWQEYPGAAADSVVIERRVPDIPDSLQNIAPFASQIAASSTYVNAGLGSGDFSPSCVVDGITGLKFVGEWASTEMNPWIRLQWAQTHRIKKIVLYDRCYVGCSANKATVTFSDGSTAINMSIPAGGSQTAIFGTKAVTWVNIQLTGAGSPAYVGLSEVQVQE